jgi:hypothetical protein
MEVPRRCDGSVAGWVSAGDVVVADRLLTRLNTVGVRNSHGRATKA